MRNQKKKQSTNKQFKTKKRISKPAKNGNDQPLNQDSYSDISGDFFQEEFAQDSMEDLEEVETETQNEKRLRLAKEIIRKKRKLLQERKASIDSRAQDDEAFALQAPVDLFRKNKVLSVDHIFAEDKGDIIKDEKDLESEGAPHEITDKQIENEFQKDIKEKENRVIYSIFDSLKASLSAKKSLPSISLKAHRRPITFCRFDPLTKDLITVSKDSAILRHSYSSSYKKKFVISHGFPKDDKGHNDEILTCDISSDGQYLATAGKDRIIKLWNLKTNFINNNGEKKEEAWLYDFKGHRADITTIRFKANSHELVSLSEDRALKIWDVSRRAFMENLYGHASDPVWMERLGNQFMISVGYDRTPILWKLEQEKIVKFQQQLFSLGNP